MTHIIPGELTEQGIGQVEAEALFAANDNALVYTATPRGEYWSHEGGETCFRAGLITQAFAVGNAAVMPDTEQYTAYTLSERGRQAVALIEAAQGQPLDQAGGYQTYLNYIETLLKQRDCTAVPFVIRRHYGTIQSAGLLDVGLPPSVVIGEYVNEYASQRDLGVSETIARAFAVAAVWKRAYINLKGSYHV